MTITYTEAMSQIEDVRTKGRSGELSGWDLTDAMKAAKAAAKSAAPDKDAFVAMWCEIATAAQTAGDMSKRRNRMEIAGGELIISAQTWGNEFSVYTSFTAPGKNIHAVGCKNPTDITAEAEAAFDAWVAAISNS